jgi:hypothetical protein
MGDVRKDTLYCSSAKIVGWVSGSSKGEERLLKLNCLTGRSKSCSPPQKEIEVPATSRIRAALMPRVVALMADPSRDLEVDSTSIAVLMVEADSIQTLLQSIGKWQMQE